MLWFRIEGCNKEEACAKASSQIAFFGTTLDAMVGFGAVALGEVEREEGGHILGLVVLLLNRGVDMGSCE